MQASSLWGIVLADEHARGDLLIGALERMLPLIPPERLIVTGPPAAVRRLAHLPGIELMFQPEDRGTAAGVLLALVRVLARDPAASVVVCPTDREVADDDAWRETVARAHAAADSGTASVVVFGSEPETAAEGRGWILPGVRLQGGFAEAAVVGEQPAERERRLIASGALRGTGTVLAKGKALFQLFRRRLPSVAVLLYATAESGPLLSHVYRVLPKHDLQEDVIQGADGLAAAVWPSAARCEQAVA